MVLQWRAGFYPWRITLHLQTKRKMWKIGESSRWRSDWNSKQNGTGDTPQNSESLTNSVTLNLKQKGTNTSPFGRKDFKVGHLIITSFAAWFTSNLSASICLLMVLHHNGQRRKDRCQENDRAKYPSWCRFEMVSGQPLWRWQTLTCMPVNTNNHKHHLRKISNSSKRHREPRQIHQTFILDRQTISISGWIVSITNSPSPHPTSTDNPWLAEESETQETHHESQLDVNGKHECVLYFRELCRLQFVCGNHISKSQRQWT